LKEYSAWTRKVLGDDSIEDGTRDTTLHDNLAEAAGFRHGLIVVEWIPVSADLGEPLDVSASHRARALRDLANAWNAARPDVIDLATHIAKPQASSPKPKPRPEAVLILASVLARRHNTPSLDYDAIIVGARCAGAATAMLLARQGLRVLAIDRGHYGSDTVSTHALMRAGVVQLSRWGVLDAIKAAGTPVIRSTSFHYGDEVVTVQIKPKDDIDGLYAPRRTVIDRSLVDAARQAGAEIVFETQFVDLVRASDGRVCGVRLRDGQGQERQLSAELVIGADGVHSTVARLVSADCYRTGRHATGVVFTYWSDTGFDDAYHWYYNPGVSAGAIPTNDGHTCIFASVPQKRFQETMRQGTDAAYRQVMRECGSDLAAIVERSKQVEKYRGFSGEIGFFRQSFGPGWALVGDAGYFKDPLTAHGITDALIDAELLARAVGADTETAFADYQSARDTLAIGHFEVTDAVASFEWDLSKAQQLHRALSDEMKKESLAVANFAPLPA
jgi:menaquinone-9 beta-reductase